MINDLDIVQWAYLLDPAFQLVNSAGKPLTDGWIEVYYHGTRNKYYCASDFDGTLHPFKIPLDSLGSNIVLASPAYAYDIYVYNKFGSLVMSRYNVSPGNTGGNSGGSVQPTDEDAEHWLGQYGATQPLYGQNAGQTLALPSNPDYHGNFVDRVEYGTINPEGGTAVYPKYMYLKPGLYLVNCVIRFQQKSGTEVNRLDELLVYTGNGNANEDVAWQLDETGPLTDGDCRHCLKLTFIRKVLDTGETSPVDCSNVLYFAPSPKVDWKDAYIQTLQIVKLGAGFGGSSSASGGVEYKAGPGISIDIYNNISVTGMQPASSMGDYVTYEVYNEFVNNVTGDLNDLQSEIDAVSAAVSGGGQVYTAGQYISIQGNEISVTGLQPEGDYASQSDLENLENVVNNVTGDVEEITNIINNVTGDVQNLTTIVENVTGDINNLETIVNNVTGDINVLETNISGVTGDISQIESDIQTVSAAVDSVSAQIPESEEVEFEELDISNFATNSQVTALEAEIQEVSAAIPTDVVTHDELANVTGDVTNLTEIVNNVSGDVTNLTEVVNNVTGDISQINVDIQNVSAAVDSVSGQIPESEEVEFEELDVSQFATNSDLQAVSAAIPDISNLATENEVQYVSGVIDAVSASIPEAQVNSDWLATSGVAEILNKPQEVAVRAGDGISITVSGDDVIISAEGGSVTGELAQLEQEIQEVSAAIPDAQVQSDWTEANTSSKAYIQHKPQQTELIAGQNIYLTDTASGLMISAEGGSVTGDYVTHDELAVVTGDFATEAELQTVSAAIDAVSALIPDAQVNADWNAVSGKAEILNKPDIMDVDIKQITAGENVTITETASAIIISAQGGGGTVTGDYATNADLQTVSAAVDAVSAEIPASEEVEFEELDLSQFVTESAVTGLEAQIQTVSAAIPDVSNLATKSEVEAAVDTVTGMIPDVSNLATESDLQTVSGAVDSVSASIPSQIEVEFKELDLSQFVTESAVTGLEADIQTVSAAIPDTSNFATEAELQTVSGAIPDVSSFATKTELQTVSGAVDSVSASIPSSEEVTFEELDVSAFATEADLQTVSAAIPDVSNLATKTEVGNVEADVQTVSAAIPDVSNFATDTEVSAAVSGLQNKLTGITDVVVTNSLPVSPVATVLYLIPEA
jgi:archaellum component FlaC